MKSLSDRDVLAVGILLTRSQKARSTSSKQQANFCNDHIHKECLYQSQI